MTSEKATSEVSKPAEKTPSVFWLLFLMITSHAAQDVEEGPQPSTFRIVLASLVSYVLHVMVLVSLWKDFWPSLARGRPTFGEMAVALTFLGLLTEIRVPRHLMPLSYAAAWVVRCVFAWVFAQVMLWFFGLQVPLVPGISDRGSPHLPQG